MTIAAAPVADKPIAWLPVAAPPPAAIVGPLIGSGHLATNGPLITGRLVAS